MVVLVETAHCPHLISITIQGEADSPNFLPPITHFFPRHIKNGKKIVGARSKKITNILQPQHHKRCRRDGNPTAKRRSLLMLPPPASTRTRCHRQLRQRHSRLQNCRAPKLVGSASPPFDPGDATTDSDAATATTRFNAATAPPKSDASPQIQCSRCSTKI